MFRLLLLLSCFVLYTFCQKPCRFISQCKDKQFCVTTDPPRAFCHCQVGYKLNADDECVSVLTTLPDPDSAEETTTERTTTPRTTRTRRTTLVSGSTIDPDDPNLVQIRPDTEASREVTACPNLQGVRNAGSQNCYNDGECFEVDSETSYCICPDGFYGHSCQNRYNAQRDTVSSREIDDMVQYKDTKYVHGSRAGGSTFARYRKSSYEECATTCIQIGQQCGSVNYGPDAGEMLCEILSIKAVPKERNIGLYKWLQNDGDFIYGCCNE